jgi:hypothetical protein
VHPTSGNPLSPANPPTRKVRGIPKEKFITTIVAENEDEWGVYFRTLAIGGVLEGVEDLDLDEPFLVERVIHAEIKGGLMIGFFDEGIGEDAIRGDRGRLEIVGKEEHQILEREIREKFLVRFFEDIGQRPIRPKGEIGLPHFRRKGVVKSGHVRRKQGVFAGDFVFFEEKLDRGFRVRKNAPETEILFPEPQ